MSTTHLLRDGRKLIFCQANELEKPETLSAIAGPFVALLAADNLLADYRWQLEKVVNLLADIGCRYFMAFGHGCEEIHDQIDEILCNRCGQGIEPLIMTTWHDDEPIDEVVFFLFKSAIFEEMPSPNQFLVVVDEDSKLQQSIKSSADRFLEKEEKK